MKCLQQLATTQDSALSSRNFNSISPLLSFPLHAHLKTFSNEEVIINLKEKYLSANYLAKLSTNSFHDMNTIQNSPWLGYLESFFIATFVEYMIGEQGCVWSHSIKHNTGV